MAAADNLEDNLADNLEDNEEAGLRSVALQNAQSILLARRRVEEELRRQSEWLRVTLSSIGDAVISTDGEGRVTFMNGVAESLTGWRQSEALGRPLTEVFRIINEHTREVVESPVARVIRKGAVVGLANHTLLLHREGGEIPIDDSGAPIHGLDGELIGVVLVFRDISERKKMEQSRARLAAIVESSDDAIIGKTLDGVITSWNKGAERLYGYTEDEVVGKLISLIFPADRREEFPRIHERLRAGERIDHFETQRVAKDGRVFDVSVTISPIRDAEGNIMGASTIARDITEQKRLEQERERLLEHERVARVEAETARVLSAQLLKLEEEARAQAEAASRLKDEFLATISHELRTPLNAIQGWVMLLRGGGLDKETEVRALETIERNARSQAKIIADLLDVSRIITGKLRLEVHQIELVPVIRAAVDVVRPAADTKGVRIQTVLDPAAGPVAGDPDRLQQVVWNLLSNAVKFTPKGGRVQVRLERVNSSVAIIVSDTGQGISPEFLPHVFDRFRQGDSSITRRYGGLGLGLAIVRHLTELHGGTVEVMSGGVGEGATFTVSLPLTIAKGTGIYGAAAADQQPPLEISDLSWSPPVLTGLRLLIVEDEPDARELLVTMLNQCEASARAVATSDDALASLSAWRPHVLISDIEMPGEDGYSLIKRVRSLPASDGGRIPAIALTAHARAQDRLRALDAGFDAHVAKPVEMAELATVIASLVRRTIV